MFDWLIPSVLMPNTSAKKQNTLTRLIDIDHLDDLYSLSHPYLTCRATIAHLRQTKVMFLMRGLPGSGKSTLVNLLVQLYSNSVVVCSADHFFLDNQGVYNFDQKKLPEAHRICQQNAEDACRNGVLAVIIDNTNIRMDECKPYCQKASSFGYLIIIVEPRTSWKRDTNSLMARNTHQVPIEVIEGRLRQYRPLIPFFFGLFLNHEQSNHVLTQAYDYYQQALRTFPQLKQDLERVSRDKNISVNVLLNRRNMSVQPKILHCTVKFIGKITDQSRREYSTYAGNRCVSHLLGKMCRGYIVGFTITPRTLGARLFFPDRHTWAIWGQDDNEIVNDRSSSQASGDNYYGHSPRRAGGSKATTTDMYTTSMAQSLADDDILLVDKSTTLDEESSEHRPTLLRPTFGFLSRAHLTCGVAPGVNASQTGLDLVDIIRQEVDIDPTNSLIRENSEHGTVMKYLGNGQCAIYLENPIPIETIFSGSFH